MTALEAIKNRDPEALMTSFSNVEEAAEFRRLVLPEQSPDDCRWFWRQVMTPTELETTMSFVRDTCIRIAKTQGLVLGKDFNAGFNSYGESVMLVPPEKQHVFYDALIQDRHSMLRIYIQDS